MCDGVSALAAISLLATAASTGVAVKGQMDQGRAQQGQANFAAAQQQYQAKVAQNQALIQENAANVTENNARLVRMQGETAAQATMRENAMRLGAQRASFAASGVDPNSGSALSIAEDTAEQGGLSAANTQYDALLRGLSLDQDATTQRYNAAVTRAGGANSEIAADNLRIGGANALGTAQTGAIGAGLAGAGQFASRWNTFSNSFGGGGETAMSPSGNRVPVVNSFRLA